MLRWDTLAGHGQMDGLGSFRQAGLWWKVRRQSVDSRYGHAVDAWQKEDIRELGMALQLHAIINFKLACMTQARPAPAASLSHRSSMIVHLETAKVDISI